MDLIFDSMNLVRGVSESGHRQFEPSHRKSVFGYFYPGRRHQLTGPSHRQF